MKRYILLACILSLPGPAQAWNSGANYARAPDRGTQNMIMHYNEIQRRAYDQDREWRRREDDQRRRAEDERQRELWRRDAERRQENASRQNERAREWEQRQAYEEWRRERVDDELLQRDAQTRKGGAYRESENKGKPLNPKELRRYELIKPGERP